MLELKSISEEVMLSRNQEQELIMKIVYSYLYQNNHYEDKDPRLLIEEISEVSYDEVSIFVKETVIKILIHKDEIIQDILPNLHKWKLERMNKIIISILLLAIGEARYIEGTVKAAIIDVAIDLAKKYADEKDYRFVNAILDKMIA